MGSSTDEVDNVVENKKKEWMDWAAGARVCPGQRRLWRWYEGKSLEAADSKNALSEACENTTNSCEEAVVFDSRHAGVAVDDSWWETH